MTGEGKGRKVKKRCQDRFCVGEGTLFRYCPPCDLVLCDGCFKWTDPLRAEKFLPPGMRPKIKRLPKNEAGKVACCPYCALPLEEKIPADDLPSSLHQALISRLSMGKTGRDDGFGICMGCGHVRFVKNPASLAASPCPHCGVCLYQGSDDKEYRGPGEKTTIDEAHVQKTVQGMFEEFLELHQGPSDSLWRVLELDDWVQKNKFPIQYFGFVEVLKHSNMKEMAEMVEKLLATDWRPSHAGK